MSIVRVPVADVAAGTEVFSSSDASQPCGMIVNAETSDVGHSLCLVELKVADQEAGNIHLGASDGPALEFQPLPYAVLDITQ